MSEYLKKFYENSQIDKISSNYESETEQNFYQKLNAVLRIEYDEIMDKKLEAIEQELMNSFTQGFKLGMSLAFEALQKESRAVENGVSHSNRAV